jgi:hypothetical protein
VKTTLFARSHSASGRTPESLFNMSGRMPESLFTTASIV